MEPFRETLLVIAVTLSYTLAMFDNCVKSTCPNGWVSYESSCYLFEDKTKLNWTAAATYCSNQDAHLAVIESPGADQMLIDMAQRLFKTCTGHTWSENHPYFWIGANDKALEGQWIWYTTNQPLAKTYTNWSPATHEPDNANNQDCALLWGVYNFAWGSYNCPVKGHYICEMNMTNVGMTDIIG